MSQANVENVENVIILNDYNGDIEYESPTTQRITYLTKKYIKKNGEVVIKQYNQTKYNTVYYMNNREVLTEHHTCACGGQYTKLNKHNHNKGKVHKMYERIFINNNNVI
jgi:hypothetical protein